MKSMLFRECVQDFEVPCEKGEHLPFPPKFQWTSIITCRDPNCPDTIMQFLVHNIIDVKSTDRGVRFMRLNGECLIIKTDLLLAQIDSPLRLVEGDDKSTEDKFTYE